MCTPGAEKYYQVYNLLWLFFSLLWCHGLLIFPVFMLPVTEHFVWLASKLMYTSWPKACMYIYTVVLLGLRPV